MQLIIGNLSYPLSVYSIALERIRAFDTKTPYSASSGFGCLKTAFTTVSDNEYDKDLLILSEYNIDSIGVFSASKLENSFGIEITKANNPRHSKIIMLFAIDNISGSIILQQASSESLLARKTIEQLINSILNVFSLISKDNDFFQSSVQTMSYSKQPKDTLKLSDELIIEMKRCLSQSYVQLSFFQDSSSTIEYANSIDERYSANVFNDFEINHSLLETKSSELSEIYVKLQTVIPKETVSFSEMPLKKALACEMISSALCHQMNWDFLRNAILKKTIENSEWLKPLNLIFVREETINDLLSGYSRPERIRAQERAELLQMVGTNFAYLNDLSEIFIDSYGSPLAAENIRESLLTCAVFSDDPVEKKIQLLLQKLSTYSGFEYVGNFCQPTIDYHLIRSFLRRGFLLPKTKRARAIITSDKIREERTVGAIRKHCSNIVVLLSRITRLSIATVNNIEWWIGRTVCDDNEPDCLLKMNGSEWLERIYKQCPFDAFCGQDSYLMSAPNYSGHSY